MGSPVSVVMANLVMEDIKQRALTLPYIGGLSESIRWILSRLGIRVSSHPFKTLKQELVHPKDPVSVSKRKGVIYSIALCQIPPHIHWAVGDRLPSSHPDTLPARVLAHPTPTGPLNRQKGPIPGL